MTCITVRFSRRAMQVDRRIIRYQPAMDRGRWRFQAKFPGDLVLPAWSGPAKKGLRRDTGDGQLQVSQHIQLISESDQVKVTGHDFTPASSWIGTTGEGALEGTPSCHFQGGYASPLRYTKSPDRALLR